MFAKLLKYEWKANAGLLTILSACALGVGLLGAGILRAIVYMSENMLSNELAAIATSSLSSMMVFVVLALVAYALAVQFITLFRFYKNKFTDEGYLTFTLPVTSHQIFLSSFLNILAWLAISVFVLICAAAMMIFIGLGEPIEGMYEALGDIFINVDEGVDYIGQSMQGFGTFLGLSILEIFVAPVYAIVLLMTSITLGCVLAKKHKILATIGMYYVINMVVNIVSSIISMVPTILLVFNGMNDNDAFVDRYFVYMALTVGLTLLLQVGLAIGGYFWSTYLMKHKLNLP